MATGDMKTEHTPRLNLDPSQNTVKFLLNLVNTNLVALHI